ncbi:MAG: aminomethyl-transferring glycine dehydrogenase [Candidatus Dasytiphilus stammeri]
MIEKLSTLEQNNFLQRHIGPSKTEQEEMLLTLKMSSLDELISSVIPNNIILKKFPYICNAVSDHEALQELQGIANNNLCYKSCIGMGYSATIMPKVILRNVLENPGWYTAYTPYQPEISQGRLEGLLNFQQVTLDLTGLEIASASLLDEATAAAEAMTMAKRISTIKDANSFFVADDLHPQTIDVIMTRANNLGFKIIIDSAVNIFNYDKIFGILFQQIGTIGQINDYSALIHKIKKHNIIICMAAEFMSLVLLKAPGKQGADIVFGSAQRFGLPMGYGGPHAAFYATRYEYKRAMPGRIIGVSRDITGNIALRMALQTREQHIKREKATSNICTSQALLAIIAGLYAVYHGPKGLKKIANRIHRFTEILAIGLLQNKFKIINKTWFDTITVEVEDKEEILKRALSFKVNLRKDIKNAVGITLDETTTREDILTLFCILIGKKHELDINKLDEFIINNKYSSIPSELERTEDILTHDRFNNYHNETSMMRYLHNLERKDLALNYAMIPLGSCTMKLNAAIEMIPMSWPKFSDIHPFCPKKQATGYLSIIKQISKWFTQLTGYDAFSLQPNSGAQGEYAGLLTIKRYYENSNEKNRNICLIPNSAHGTNPASANMAGLKVVSIECDSKGDIDLYDLRVKAKQAGKNLACIMVTYPSTHGVYEDSIYEICKIIHNYGGQVYIDGANMNAQLGITGPGYIGADVSHLNLHKTFCVPHGGGGPGMGPIGVKLHLAPFLPGHSIVKIEGNSNYSAVSSAPFGSASLLPICWMYIRMMGTEGLKKSSQIAILNANYIANKLKLAYPLLYVGNNGYVAHECILDIRPLKLKTGISEVDIAKRLIDYGFHPPTISFPVRGTLMIEPTESEDKSELDRFINAMFSIRKEIDLIATGKWSLVDNPLVNAPHTQEELVSEYWIHSYTKKEAVFPISKISKNKFWPTVKRLDDVFGDKNLKCSLY